VLLTQANSDPTKTALVGRLTQEAARQLTDIECELLHSVGDDGELQIIATEEIGRWVRTGGKDFLKEQDAAHAAKFADAVQTLMNKGLFRHEAGILYCLTGTGWQEKQDIEKRRLGDGSP
jgi:hypothetical protein